MAWRNIEKYVNLYFMSAKPKAKLKLNNQKYQMLCYFIFYRINIACFFFQIDILCNDELLGKDHTLKFVYVTRWRFRDPPLRLQYRPKIDL